MKTTIRLPKALYQRVHARSQQEHRPVATILAEIIREALGQTPKNSPRHTKPDDHRLWREELLE